MNGFEKHNLTHSSPSQINLWDNEPSKWVAQYLHKKRGPGSAAMWRGICTEDAVVAVLAKGQSIDDAVAEAERTFDTKTTFMLDSNIEKERGNIKPMTELAVDALAEYGAPEFPDHGAQHKIEITCQTDTWSLPIIGYLDLVYPDHGLIVDLKTTLRMPSVMSVEHRRQRAVYAKAMGNHQVKFLYVTPKKSEFKEDGDISQELTEIKNILIRQERFLNAGDAGFLTSIVPVHTASFYWKGETTTRQELFGI